MLVMSIMVDGMILKIHEPCGRSVEDFATCKWCIRANKKLPVKGVGRDAGDKACFKTDHRLTDTNDSIK